MEKHLVHLLESEIATTFLEYAVDAVLSFIQNELTIANELILFGIYMHQIV